ncbi:coiled-coil-helix-coiled-coil-helix domain containing 3 isoform X2 [Rhodnius prolixus]|uniref:coiled-coil-helix-coiled-coil-helix domain containing 3 isoform X2 n=1 Tax=Rhodnius prolixus TaxID=13249 RepID=UPI003D18CE2B
MGGQHSTQRISIDNEGDPASVIKVSESVVDRLKGGTDQTMEKEEEEISKPNVLEKEIQKNNEYWEKRIGELQKTHEQMDKIMEEEYLKATEEIKKILPKVRPANAKLPCQGGRSDVTKCYKSHPQQPLNCAAEVEQFANCLTNTRIKLQDEDKI